jgi:O-antigen ligase
MHGRHALLLGVLMLVAAFLGVAVSVGGNLMQIMAAAILAVTLLLVAAPIREWALLAWLFCSPYMQEAARATPLGRALNNGPYLFLGVGLVLWAIVAVLDRVRSRKIRMTDFAPALLVLVSFVSLLLGEYFPQGWTRGDFIRQLYGNLMLPVAGFYVMSWGLKPEFYMRWWKTLWLTSWGVSALAILEHFTGFQVWGYVKWQGVDIGRSVGPLANPVVLGTFAGMAIASASAYLIWSRRDAGASRIATVTILLAVPALWFTYARASVIATVVAVLLIGALKSEFRFVFLLATVLGGVGLVASWGLLSESTLVTERIGNVSNAQARILLALWSLELFVMRPWTGWGYGSFDAATTRATSAIANIPTAFARADTSHNTLLTVLVELGIGGLLLTLFAWIPPLVRGLRGAFRRRGVDWLLLSAAAAVFVYWVNASFIDMRFFSLPALLAWMALGILQGHEDQSVEGDV